MSVNIYQSAFGFRAERTDENGVAFESAEGKTVDEALTAIGMNGALRPEMLGIVASVATAERPVHVCDFGSRWNQRMDELGAERPTTDEIVELLGEKK